jgi:hypothetical protein
MKSLTTLVTTILLMSSAPTFAHTDHALGEGAFHFAYHIVFYGLIIVAAVKAIKYFRREK